jgi:hypothetical protein
MHCGARAKIGIVILALNVVACESNPWVLPPPRFPNEQPGPKATALHNEALRELEAARSTSYAHKIRIDEDTGVFDHDCSGFVDYALSNVSKAVLDDVRAVRGQHRPNARAYVILLRSIAPGESRRRWLHVARVSDLVAGDVIAWTLVDAKVDALGIVNSGHVMIVDGAPQERASADSETQKEWVVPVIDSSSNGHGGTDRRHAPDASGLGRGAIVLATEDGSPVGYFWSASASKLTRTHIVLGHPL